MCAPFYIGPWKFQNCFILDDCLTYLREQRWEAQAALMAVSIVSMGGPHVMRMWWGDRSVPTLDWLDEQVPELGDMIP